LAASCSLITRSSEGKIVEGLEGLEGLVVMCNPAYRPPCAGLAHVPVSAGRDNR
jgi:hypothetical protein